MPHKLLQPGRRGKYWYLRGTDAEGRFEYSTGQETRRGAEAWTETFLVQRARNRVPGASEAVGFRDAARFYKAFRNPSKADSKLIDEVAGHLGNVDCRTITHAQLVAAANEMKPGAAASTKNRKIIGPAAAVLHYAANQSWCEYQRIEKFWVSRKSSRSPASDETVALLIANVEKVRTNKRGRKKDLNVAQKRLLLAVLYETGLRISHLLRLAWSEVDLTAGRIVVRIPKSDETASVPISPVIVSMLANLPAKYGRVFPWATRRGVYAWLTPLVKKLDVIYTPHMSRHALATAAGAAKIPDKEAALLGVWRDPRSLHRYQHVRPDAIPGRTAGTLLGKPRKISGR
jgi:integrase